MNTEAEEKKDRQHLMTIVSAKYCCTGLAAGFAAARLGHTLSFLSGYNKASGAFMTQSLLAMFGMTSYPVMSIIV